MVSKDPRRMNNGVDGEKIASEMVLFFCEKIVFRFQKRQNTGKTCRILVENEVQTISKNPVQKKYYRQNQSYYI